MRGHSLTHHSLQPGQSDTVLVLQKLTHCTDPSVAKMINIVIAANTIFQMDIIVDGSQNVFLRNMLRNQLVHVLLNRFSEHLRIITVLL